VIVINSMLIAGIAASILAWFLIWFFVAVFIFWGGDDAFWYAAIAATSITVFAWVCISGLIVFV